MISLCLAFLKGMLLRLDVEGEIVRKLLGSRVMDDDNGLKCDTPFVILIEG